MPVVFQHRIYRADLVANPDVLYVFGDNDQRQGYGGQAKEMRGEENAIGIRTKWQPNKLHSSYFSDSDYQTIMEMIDIDFEPIMDHLEEGGIVVFPLDGIGTGLADLENRAPMVFDYLCNKIEMIKDVYGASN